MAKAGNPEKVEKERASFRQIIAKNPNYFGTMPKSSFKAEKKISSNTKYEEISCIGYNPDLDLLEAVVKVKLPYGYGGDLCKDGSFEYVRFYADFGSGWQDAGLTAFTAHDIPNSVDCAKKPDKPLTYSVGVQLNSKRKCCDTPFLPRVRAILSWQMEPPAGDPDWTPVWGNVGDAAIQIKPKNKIWCMLATIEPGIWEKFKIKQDEFLEYVKPIPLPDPPYLGLQELIDLYGPKAKAPQKVNVEPHRFGFPDIQKTLTSTSFNTVMVEGKVAEWKKLGLQWGAAVEALEKTKGDVSYEELECLALDAGREWLTATFSIKRPCGFSGDLCSKGSTEYVAFWADWEDSCEWTYLGTAQVNVHDIAAMPPEGLRYAAFWKVNLDPYRRPCDEPRIGRVRAVLSWNSPPSETDPDAVPYWGNRIDAHVQIRPGLPIVEVEPVIWTLGGIFVDQVAQAGADKGMTTPTATFALSGLPPDAYGRPCPFGGRVAVTGPAFPGYYYRVRVREFGTSAWVNVVTELKNLKDMSFVSFDNAPVNEYGFFQYVENIEDVLARWDTTGSALWEVKLELASLPDEAFILDEVAYLLQIDNTWPNAEITIDSGGACKDFLIEADSKIQGHFVARDEHLGSFRLYTLPYAAPAGALTPLSGIIQTAVSPGDAWELETEDMVKCGYVMVVEAVDRTIRDSGAVGHYSYASVGFCLREKS